MNIVLIGYRGSGKSTVAALLAKDLGMPHACLDKEIVRSAGASIPQIVERHGWEYFRDLESRVVDEFSVRQGWVLDTGGGVILRDRNVGRLRENGFLVWLKAPPAVLIERIKDDTQRPALKAGKTFLEEVEEVLAEREPLYRAAANAEIDVSTIPPRAVVARIRELLAEHGLP